MPLHEKRPHRIKNRRPLLRVAAGLHDHRKIRDEASIHSTLADVQGLCHIFATNMVLLEMLTVAQLINKLPAFMEPEGSLPCAKEPATGPYPERDASNPYPPSVSLRYNCI